MDTLLYKPDWPETRRRFEAFWQREIVDRCMLAVTVMTNREKASIADPRAWYTPDKTEEEILAYWLSPECVLNKNLQKFGNTLFLGDAIPQVYFDLGAAAHAGFFEGARWRYTSSMWFAPTLPEGQIPAFDPGSRIYRAMREVGALLGREGAGKFLVAMPDNAGIVDALAHLRGTENLLMDFVDDRDWVRDCREAIQRVWNETTQEAYELIAPCNDGGSGIGWLNVWAPGKISQMQCDFSVMISPEDFRELVVPELEACMAWMDHSLYHLDGVEQVRHLDALLGLEALEAIQWTCVAGQPPPTAYIDELRRIQRAGKRLVIANQDMNVIEALSRELSSEGLLLVTTAPDALSATRLLERVGRNTHA